MQHRFSRGFSVAALAAMVLLMSVTFPVEAQVLSGSITGSVQDASGAVVAGAGVTAVDLATNQQYKTTSGPDGEFVLPQVPYGFYRITVSAPGFAKTVFERVQVNVSQTAHVAAKLKVEAAGTEVVVAASQEAVQTETIELKNSIDRRQIMDLPLPTRNPLDLVRTMAGVSAPTSSGIGDTFVHGLRGSATNITQDGVNVADNFVKTSSFFAISAPTVDTVGEFNVSVGGIGTDAGFGAAQVNIVTARGQNAYHGSAFWFQRTSFLNANTFFNNAAGIPTPFQLQNRIGFNLGGPITIPKLYHGKNKTWFFTQFEAFREPRQQNRTRVVLADAARTGQFTYRRVDTGQLQTVNLLSLGTRPIDSTVMNFYNSLVPSPNTDAGCSRGDAINIRCFAWNVPSKNQTNRYTARIDHQLTSSHALEFVYNQANFLTFNDVLNGIEQIFPKSNPGAQESKRQVFTWALHSVFGSTKTNTARFGLTRAPVGFSIKDDYSALGGFQLTTPGVLSDPTFTSANIPQGRNTPVRQVSDDFGWVRSRHTMRFGGEYRQILANSFFFNTVIPRVTLGSNNANPDGLSNTATQFPGGISAADLTAAKTVYQTITGMLGTVAQGFNHTSPTSGFVSGAPRTITPIQNNFAYYFQDNWRFKPQLTLQYGVRWEYQGVFDLRNKLILQPDDRVAAAFGAAGVNNYFNVLATPAATDVSLQFAGGRNGKPLYDRDWNNFAPFAGFAWDPWNNGKTAIRGGFALHYTQDGITLYQTGSTGNNGLFSVQTNSTPVGAFNPTSVPTPATPADVFPVSQRTNFATSNTADLFSFKQDMATPYVQEWNFAVQREVGKKITVEARYVGNHAVKLYRSTNLNEINLFNNPFTFGGNSVPNLLTEFLHAQQNQQVCVANSAACIAAQQTAGLTATQRSSTSFGNWGLTGQVPLPVLQALFGSATSSNFSNSSFMTPVQQSNVGVLFDTLRRSPTFATNRNNNFPLNYFVPDPFARNSILVDNSSWSTYHGLEMEVRRRFASGLFFQANYTYSKALGDNRFLTNQQELQAYRTLADRSLDKQRLAFDQTHAVSVNFLYPLPIGRGQRIAANSGAFLDKLIGGWNLQGLTRWSTGSPFTISSGRQTTGAAAAGTVPFQETAVLRNMSIDQLRKFIGTFKTDSGVFWLDPKSGLLTIAGANSTPVLCTPGQTTPCFDVSAPGTFGNLPFLGFEGPEFFNQDLSVVKRTSVPSISENFNFEIRLEAFNVFNHPSFQTPFTLDASNNPLTGNLQSTQFGKLTDIVDTVRGGGINSRVVQWAIRVNF